MSLDPATALNGISKQIDPNCFQVERAKIVEACAKLHASGFEHLISIAAIDWKKSWEIVYHLAKFGRKEVVMLKVQLPYQDPKIPTVTSIWPGAEWHERESYDLMGITFIGGRNKRILLPDNFEGHPLRKEVKYGNTS
jgi:NADH-quinone oxidoreductase subunit C